MLTENSKAKAVTRAREVIAAVCVAVSMAWSAGGAHAQASQAPARSIRQVVGNLYMARNAGYNTVFLVTPDGIILSDTLNRDFSEWLRNELKQRFDLPVRYVIYSHHHEDHASGGAVFADTADFIGHYSMAEALARPNPATTSMPRQFSAMDTNSDAVIARSEASGRLAATFDLYDFDGDGVLTGAELAGEPVADVHMPNIFFTDDGYTLTFGGSTVEMIHVGPIEARDMTVLRFPAEHAVFVVDFMSPERLPRTDLAGPLRAGATIDEWIDAVRTVDAMDYDVMIPGHGDVGTHEQAASYSQYLEDLRDGVAEGIEKGMSLADIQSALLLKSYSRWANYDIWRTQNIEGMYRVLTKAR